MHGKNAGGEQEGKSSAPVDREATGHTVKGDSNLGVAVDLKKWQC